MPCNRRRNHGGGLRFRPCTRRPGFHPLFAMVNELHDLDEEEQIAASIFGKDKARWNETESNFIFDMDIPGVKAHHVTIEEKDGEIEVTAIRMKGKEVIHTFQDVFFVRPSKADLSNVLATLSDGVLTIIVPKKNQETLELAVNRSAAPAAAEKGTEFRISMDLPGVKTADLKVQVRDDKVQLEATRKVGDHTIRIRRIANLEPSNIDMTLAKVFLQDGVLTMVAPIPKDDEDDKNENSKPGAPRNIFVQEVSGMESLSLEEKEKKEEGHMVVETVTEGDHDWEDVNQKKSSEKED